MEEELERISGGSAEADHLCVLVHGLWGNPTHMTNVARTLRTQYEKDKLYILATKRNTGNFTYDGIETCGERVCVEVEETLQAVERKGGKIRKLSFVGYSLGGLVARYAIGLLHANGVLDNLECMNFAAFASPFLGTRAPLRGTPNHVWNVLMARALGRSGRQLFGIDTFRDTGKPLLTVLAGPNSIFISALRRFARRTLYANIASDLSSVYYTSMIGATDPYVDRSKIEISYAPGYEDVVLDRDDPVRPRGARSPEDSLAARARVWARNAPLIVALAVLLPFGIVAFALNSVVQTVFSARRVRLHEGGRAGVEFDKYRSVPMWIDGVVRGAVEGAYETINSAHAQAHLPEPEPELEPAEGDAYADADANGGAQKKLAQPPHWPTLALADYQFDAIRALDAVGWRKYPVWIHDTRRSHAAIVVRVDGDSLAEGKVVLKHWLNEEFLY